MVTEINPLNSVEKSLKKRVLFIITQSEFGGAQRFLHTLVSRLDNTTHETLIAGGPGMKTGNYELLDRLGKEGCAVKKLKHLRRGVNPLEDLLAIFEIRKMIREFNPGVVFLLSSKAGFLGSFVSRFMNRDSANAGKKIKVIYRIGGWSFNDPRPRLEKLLWVFLEKFSAKWKDFIVVNSKTDFSQAVDLKIKPRKSLVLVYNGLDVFKNNYLPKEEARLRLFEMASRQFGRVFQSEKIIGTIANFYPAKGLDFLIDTAEFFKNNDEIIFFLIGEGPEHQKLDKIIKEKGLNKKVLLLGQIPDASRFLCAFDIFVLPSIKEGSPWAVIEAMAARLPVIATRVGAVPEIIEDDKNGILVDVGKPEQIASKIMGLLNNGRYSQELGIQAHQTVLFKFPLEKMMGEIESIIK